MSDEYLDALTSRHGDLMRQTRVARASAAEARLVSAKLRLRSAGLHRRSVDNRSDALSLFSAAQRAQLSGKPAEAPTPERVPPVDALT